MICRPRFLAPRIRADRTLNAIRIQVPERILVARAFGEDRPPESFSLLVVAAFSSQLGEIAPGDVAVDPLVDAGEFLGLRSVRIRRQARSASSVSPRCRCATPLRNHSSASSGSRERPSAQVRSAASVSPMRLLDPGEQSKQLAGDRIARRRAGQASLEVGQGVPPLLALDGDHSEVEEDERVIGPLAELAEQDPRVAVELSSPARRDRCSRYAGS